MIKSLRDAARLCVAALAAGFGAPVVADEPPVDFARDIEPILRTNCLECHGPMRQSAGLRLDTRAHAEAGGVSGLLVLGGTLQTNELWRRVSSDDPRYRMPRFEDPLGPEELELVRRWVEQGTPWPEHPEPVQAVPPVWRRVYDRGIAPLLPFLLALAVVALLLEQLQKRLPARAPRAARTLGQVRPAHALVVATVLIAVNQFVSTSRLQAQYDELTGPSGGFFGDPPVPRRPDHGRRLHGTYYRGNCERSDRLYNGGSYRTCSFHVALVDAEDRRLDYGDPVPPGGLFVRFEIERAQNATEQLFTPAIMKGVFLAEDVLPRGSSPAPQRYVMLETLEPGWRWAARYPIGEGETDLAEGALSGLVYIYRGAPAAETDIVPSHTLVHYAVSYDLRWIDGRIVPESELWLGALYTNDRVASPPEPGRVPFESWFSWRPLPEIEGEPSDDPD